MAEPLKNAYNQAYIAALAAEVSNHYPNFNTKHFTTLIFDVVWQGRELKQRMRHITECLHQCLPQSYPTALDILKPSSKKFSGFEALFFPDFVERYGMDHFEISMVALEHFTQFSSSEFAIRPFIIQYPKKTMQQMNKWAFHSNEHVRRLATEGSRPRLPWAMHLPNFIADPSSVLEILEKLKHDESLYVRRSVANNLNDIAKDHVQVVLDIAQRWVGHSDDTDRLVKHACRTLLKQAHPEALALFGYTPAEHIQVKNFQVSPKVSWGGKVVFSATLDSDKPLGKIRIEFAVDFMKANGETARKVFKISEFITQETSKKVQKNFNFKPITTRKYYAGKHQLSLIINGHIVSSKAFNLLAKTEEAL